VAPLADQDPDKVATATACDDSDGGLHGLQVLHCPWFPSRGWCVLWLVWAPRRVRRGYVDCAMGHELVSIIRPARTGEAIGVWHWRICQKIRKCWFVAWQQCFRVRLEDVKELLG
jgi:hypothetical protein